MGAAADLERALAALPGAAADPPMPRGGAVMWKVGGKLFAILSGKRDWVIVKSDPHLIEVLKGEYAGIGHRSHLDRRFWISVPIGADVPAAEVERLAAGSYDRVKATLTKKQQAALA